METTTIAYIKQLNQQAGNCWFSPDTLRFFKSRVASTVYLSADGQRGYFTSSEQGPSGIRRWSVRVASLKTGDIDTVGEFQAYATQRAATKAAQAAAGTRAVSAA